jgi:hypothetical protein
LILFLDCIASIYDVDEELEEGDVANFEDEVV